jgi:microcystin-dependent protein
MAQPYLGQISLFSFNFAPRGWAMCNGQLLPIVQNQALFAILGTTYGGNGTNTFQLPNLQSRTPIGYGTGVGLTPNSLGQTGGEENHTLLLTEMPSHMHPVQATSVGPTSGTPAANSIFATPAKVPVYRSAGSATTQMNTASIANAGGSQPHTNIQPYLTINFCIALNGVFPSRN